MLIPDLLVLKLLLIRALIYLLEDILKSPIILLQNRILGAHIQRQGLRNRELETRVCEPLDALVGVVLGLRDPAAGLELVDFDFLGLATFGSEDHLEGAVAFYDEVFGAVLVAEGVASDDDGFLPAWYQAGDAGDDNGFSEDGSAQGVADGSIGREPHCLLVLALFCSF